MWDECGAEQRQLVGEAPTLADEISLVVAMHSQRGLRRLMRWVFWLTKSRDRAKIERVGTQVSLDQVWGRRDIFYYIQRYSPTWIAILK